MESRRSRTPVIATVFGMTCVVVLAAVFLGAGPGDSQPKPVQSITPSLSPESDVRGWPTTGRNPPGVYSYDPFYTCRGSCNHGWMHNGYGSNDLEIWMVGLDPLETSMPEWASDEIDPGGGSLDDGTPVVVAGHDGFYRRVDDRHELWMVDIQGRSVAIQLTAKPGTSRGDMAEAHTIINSMRTEPSDHLYVSFSLVFTLTSNDWDSG